MSKKLFASSCSGFGDLLIASFPPSLIPSFSINRATSVARLIHQPILLEPRHHLAQTCADFLDGVLAPDAAHGVQLRGARLILEQKFLGIGPRLDVLQNAPHLVLGL